MIDASSPWFELAQQVPIWVLDHPLSLVFLFAPLIALLLKRQVPAAPLMILLGVGLTLASHSLALVTYWAVLLLAWPLVVSRGSALTDQQRWRSGVGLMVASTALFALARAFEPPAEANTALLESGLRLMLDMMCFMRLLALFWEYGTGKLKKISSSVYWAWGFLAPNMPLVLRPSEMAATLPTAAARAGMSNIAKPEWRKLFLMGIAQFVLLMLIVKASEQLAVYQHRYHMPYIAFQMFVAMPWGFYLAAAGAANLFICAALLMGLTIPPNYNAPFGRPNISEFWANWNMTITRLLRDIFFYQRWGLKRPNLYVNSLVLFAACGLWHAFNAYWLIWGLLHGLIFSFFLWAKGQGWLQHRILGHLFKGWSGSALTYVLVCLCWYFPNKILAIF